MLGDNQVLLCGPPDRERAKQAEVMRMRAQLAEGLGRMESKMDEYQNSVQDSMDTYQISVDASVSELSNTVSGLSTVATTGNFSDLIERPTLISEGIITYEHQCKTAALKTHSTDLGAAPGRYCALARSRYIPRP
jgi:hypothetical protein